MIAGAAPGSPSIGLWPWPQEGLVRPRWVRGGAACRGWSPSARHGLDAQCRVGAVQY